MLVVLLMPGSVVKTAVLSYGAAVVSCEAAVVSCVATVPS